MTKKIITLVLTTFLLGIFVLPNGLFAPFNSVLKKTAFAQSTSSHLDVRVYKGVVLFTLVNVNYHDVMYNIYVKVKGEYVPFTGLGSANSSDINHANFLMNGDYAMDYQIGEDGVPKTDETVYFSIKDSVNTKHDPFNDTIVNFDYPGQPVMVSTQFKGKFAVADSIYGKPVTYNMYTIQKDGSLKFLYTRKSTATDNQVYFPQVRKYRYLLITSSINGKIIRNTFVTFSPDCKWYDTFQGLKK